MKSYLSVICGTGSKQRIQRVVSRNQETGKVNQELAGNVEENEEKVDSDNTQDGVDLGDRGLSLEVVEKRVLGELRERESFVSFGLSFNVQDLRQKKGKVYLWK